MIFYINYFKNNYFNFILFLNIIFCIIPGFVYVSLIVSLFLLITFLLIEFFEEGIQFLSKHNNGYDIVFRPHPSENIDCWKVLLEGIPNVHVVREGAINAWVQKAFATLHHACTTAIECSLSQKPLVTYVSRELKDHLY